MIDRLTGIDFPFYQSQVEELFDAPNEQEWAQNYMRVCDLTEFKEYFTHVTDYEGNPWKCKIYCNYVLIEPLKRAFRFLVERNLSNELQTYDGCFNIRKSKGGRIMSMHSWGLAVDFNAASNGYGEEPTLSPEFVTCFAECGFEWGGLWSTPDGMHFQLPWVKDRTGPLAPIPWMA